MHTVELLEQSMDAARRLGYRVRHECLDGVEGGICEFGGRTWIFLDVTLAAEDRLDQVLSALQNDPRIFELELSGELRKLLGLGKAA